MMLTSREIKYCESLIYTGDYFKSAYDLKTTVHNFRMTTYRIRVKFLRAKMLIEEIEALQSRLKRKNGKRYFG